MLLCIHVGVLGFYHLNLNPILQYSNLKTEVFQAFKEIGNGIIFCLLMEQCLVCLSF